LISAAETAAGKSPNAAHNKSPVIFFMYSLPIGNAPCAFS
jgi:hypothetical protein